MLDMDDKTLKELAQKVRRARNFEGISQETLAYRAGVSNYAVGKIENAKPISDENLGKILLTLGLKTALGVVRKETNKLAKYKEFTIEELRACSGACKDIIRDGSPEEKSEVIIYKKVADAEILSRLREAFRGESAFSSMPRYN